MNRKKNICLCEWETTLRMRRGRFGGMAPRAGPLDLAPIEHPAMPGRRQEFAAAPKVHRDAPVALLISSDLRFGQPSAQDSPQCCNPSPDNWKGIWTC